MVTIRRGWNCAPTCEPSNPCHMLGCPAARQASYNYNPNPNYYNPGYGPRPNNNPNPQSFWRRFNFRSGPNPDQNRPDGTVRIGVGNASNTDIEIDVRDNLVRGGRRRVDIGSGNYAARSNMGQISGNMADADDLMIGVDNYSGSGDNNIRVMNNDLQGGFGRVRVGSGNYAGGSNRIIIGGNGSDTGGRSGPIRNSGSGGNNSRPWRRSWGFWF